MLKDETYKGSDDPLIRFLATPCSYERILTAYDPFDKMILLLDEEDLYNVEFNKLKQPVRRDERL